MSVEDPYDAPADVVLSISDVISLVQVIEDSNNAGVGLVNDVQPIYEKLYQAAFPTLPIPELQPAE